MINFPLPRIDIDDDLKKLLLKYSRFKEGEIWSDKKGRFKIGCFAAEDNSSLKKMIKGEKPVLAIHDPPYNLVAFKEMEVKSFVDWCSKWINNSYIFLAENSSLYIWLGADQNNHFQPLADFILMMKDSGFTSKSFITMRNQRGYGTQKNWMAVRQELLYYTKGKPGFNIEAEYTDIPKILRGYYKKINGKVTENFERSNSENIRAGNVWVDIQQVFYRMEENVNGCYAQKPLKAIERIVLANSKKNDIIIDFFSHSGTTLLAAAKQERRSFVSDVDPVYCEITLRRLENYLSEGKTGWQNSNPFMNEILTDRKLSGYLKKTYGFEVKDEVQDQLKD